jgi:HK97 family phage prohead protease
MKKLKYINTSDFKICSDIPAGSDELIIEGWASVYDVVNSWGDMLTMGCAAKTLSEGIDRIAILSQHDMWDDPIGKLLSAEETTKEGKSGIWIKVRISDAEDDIKIKIREGILKELSIGYSTVNGKVITKEDGSTYWMETEIRLYEVSLVTRAANPEAVITTMNAENADRFTALLDIVINKEKDIKLKYQLTQLRDTINATQPTEEVTKPVEVKEGKVNTIDYQAIINRLKLSL